MVEWSRKADRQLEALEQQGLGGLPICMAKTPYSLSHDPLIKNRPTQFVFEINEVRVSTGAGFVYPLAGDVVTMPGMPRTPRTLDLDKDGNVTGLSS
jgi:formate--tetrahydrofolate ligase